MCLCGVVSCRVCLVCMWVCYYGCSGWLLSVVLVLVLVSVM